MIKIPKDLIISKIKEKTNLSDAELQTKVKDKLDQLSGLISEEGALHIIANELGVKILEDPGKLQVKNVLAGMRNVQITAKVVKIYEVREFNKDNRKGKVGNFLIGDQTGVMRVVAWNDKADLLSKLSEQDTIKIENGYARDNRGKTEIHLGDKTVIDINPSGAEKIEVKSISESERKSIKELGESEQSVEILGTIVQVFDPRFFTVDPESGKRAVEREGKYYLGDQEISAIDYSYVTNIFLDDGTENIRVVLWKNQTQNLFNMSHEDILSKQSTGFEEIKNELLGNIVKLKGRTNKNEMFDRIEFIAQFVDIKPDPDEEISRLNKKLEEEPAASSTPVEPKPVKEVVQEVKPVQDKAVETTASEGIKVQTAGFSQEKIDVEETPLVQESEKVVADEPIFESSEVVQEVEEVKETTSEEILTNEEIPKTSTSDDDSKLEKVTDKKEEVVPIDLDAASPSEKPSEEIEEIDDIEELTDIESI